ncbi:GDSL family lipase [Saccharibacillus sp. O23]|uniref:SGNH/GDSL hydrolase family protein n=1 Tax=Saccharibacillus sp. O23 TaxID=2009338 RepID=UPI000B4E4962|nr:SGNH/GDSL hydrolase family protein [Saccharibacillus sp. O23]OWR26507.1 GDSL family lipase [Saccharibacillus sp. O23]
MKIFKANRETVKSLGRTHEYNGSLWLALSGSGAAFSFVGRKAEIVLKGDGTAQGTENFARIGINVNGKRVVEDLMDRPIKTYTVFDGEIEEPVEIEIIKLSEAAMSTVGIEEIRLETEATIEPAPARDLKIEVIGDSITCGYGVDDESGQNPFSTATEDATRAYAYLTAQTLRADYSLVSYSGYGIISGYTDNGEKLLTHILPDYYEKLAKSEGRLDGTLDPLTVEWDFERFAPDLIVINLGTNDDSYAQDHADRQAEFAERYAEFLHTVRRRSPQAAILCTLGIMGDRLCPFVEQAVARYVSETGDERVSAMRFDVQRAEDGYGSDGHPSAVTHARAAEKLAARIRALLA